MKTFAAIFLGLLLLAGSVRAQGFLERKQPLVEKGNQAFSEQHYQQAFEAYEQAEGQLQNEPRLHFNRGGALFKLEKYAEAREAFLRAMGVEDPVLKKKNLYNIGNTFLAEGALSDAAAYFRRALELDPEDDDARYNLELVLRAQQQQKENQQKDSNNKQQQQDQQQNQEQQKKEQNNQQDQDQKQQNQDQQQQNQQQQKQQDQKQQQQSGQEGQQTEEHKEQHKQPQKDAQQQQQPGQQNEPNQPQQQQPQLAQEQPADSAKGQDQPSEQRELSPQQIEALLRAIKEGERPFQMQRFVLPELSRRQVDKDW